MRDTFELVLYKALAELKAESARVYLGLMWWIVEPLVYVVTFYLVFDLVLHRGGEGFVPFLLTGLVAWKWFASTVSSSSMVLRSNAGLMRQVYFPKFILPLIIVVAGSIKFLLVFAILLIFLVAMGYMPSMYWIYLPLVISVQFLLIWSISSFTASIIPFLPDLKMVVTNGITLLMFLSGIFFDITTLSPESQKYLMMNPVAVVIQQYRHILIGQVELDWFHIIYVMIFSTVLLAASLVVLKKYDRIYPKIII